MASQFVYLARHGITVANETQVVQGLEDPLSERGHGQAKRLAERAKQLPFDVLVSSDLLRAKQTATYIAEVTYKEIVLEPKVREVQQADQFIGLSGETKSFQNFLVEERSNFHNPEWRVGNAENFSDSSSRALSALEAFASYGESKLFVVSHGHFIRFLVATVLLDLSLTPEAWAPMSRSIRTHNTGISVLQRDTITGKWMIESINDVAHFADQ